MKKIIKFISGLFLGVVITVGVSTVAKADVVYYVDQNGVYAKDSGNPWYAVKLPAGTVIPAGSTVTFNMTSTNVEAANGLFYNPRGNWWSVASFDAATNAQVTYTSDGKIELKPGGYYWYTPTGNTYLGTCQAQQDAAAIAQYAAWNGWNYALNNYNVWNAWDYSWNNCNTWCNPYVAQYYAAYAVPQCYYDALNAWYWY